MRPSTCGSCAEGTLSKVEGLGASSCKIIAEYVQTGRSTDFDEVTASVPAGLLPLLQISGLGPKTISLLWKERGVVNLEGLGRKPSTTAPLMD